MNREFIEYLSARKNETLAVALFYLPVVLHRVRLVHLW